ncbi:MAG: hypothetical protein QOJ80_404 [Mycobacterium sp.]|jgi:uncharacterized RDD family membrane protein YckC|nr:hypothetical protein [Mycobacterium sp.]
MVELILAANDDGSGAAVGAGFIVLMIISFIAYWIPTIVALIRNVPNKGSVIVINLFLGWTIVGWVVALAMAARSHPAPPQYPYPQYPDQPR